ncbi:MAG: diguanylate cyclase [Thermoleophilia bacterium]|nr:diguanylate cyclase [Thermoleophilia bacterium]
MNTGPLTIRIPGRRASRCGRALSAGLLAAVLGVLALAGWSYATSRWWLLLVVALGGPLVAVALNRLFLRGALEATRLALTDQLTGLGNYRRFLERLERDGDAAGSAGRPLALCLLDVDNFKRVNDRFGHPAGDRVLAEVAACLRHGGEAFRLGGDEFALLLPGRDEAAAVAIAEAVLRRVRAATYSHGEAVTVSAGVAVFPADGLARSGLVRAADSALYHAKGGGRDCVRAHRLEPEWDPGQLVGSGPTSVLVQAAAALQGAVQARGLESGHGAAAGELAARVARRMGLAPEHVDLIRVAATLSDVGKLALPDELLSKSGPLTETERRALERHPLIGSEILDSLGADAVATWVRHHHERWDGDGYPGRLAGERIPLGARILFVADAFEAMTSDQAWRPGLTCEEAVAELERCAGTQFDPEVVAAFAAELAPALPLALPVAVGA